MRTLLAVTALALSAGTGFGQTECSRIDDPNDRLACYDAASGRSSGKDKPATTPADQQVSARRAYRAQIERAFLRSGHSVDVSFHPNDRSLFLYGFWSKAMVYQIITETDLLARSKQIGFKRIDFFSKADGRWIFDLSGSGPPPRCSINKNLCW